MPDAETLNPHNLLSHLRHTHAAYPLCNLTAVGGPRPTWPLLSRRRVQGGARQRDMTRVAGRRAKGGTPTPGVKVNTSRENERSIARLDVFVHF